MKIAQIANNWSEFHPQTAIGIAAVVRDVSVGLMNKGHTVTVFAPYGSEFPGMNLRCVGKSFKALGIHLFHPDSPKAQTDYAREVVGHLNGFDVIHSHTEHVFLPFVKDLSIPVVSTIHGAGFEPREQAIFNNYPNEIFVALSEHAKLALPYIHFSHVVYNGIEIEKAVFHEVPQPPAYLAWMGRFAQNKGVLDAIEAGKTAGDIILLIGFEEKGQEEYFAKVNALVDGASVRLLDRMIRDQKYSFLGNAKAFLFPIHWEEPFGLVMAEAMACGTPVIGYNRGSVAEVVRDGVTGFIIDPPEEDIRSLNSDLPYQKGRWVIKKQGIDGIVEAIKRISEIDRSACRKHIEEHFTVEKMVEGYEHVYQKLA